MSVGRLLGGIRSIEWSGRLCEFRWRRALPGNFVRGLQIVLGFAFWRRRTGRRLAPADGSEKVADLRDCQHVYGQKVGQVLLTGIVTQVGQDDRWRDVAVDGQVAKLQERGSIRESQPGPRSVPCCKAPTTSTVRIRVESSNRMRLGADGSLQDVSLLA